MVGNGGNHLQICYVFYTTSAKLELTFTTRVPSFIRICVILYFINFGLDLD